jgi:predicted O-linked N-acetylglucosamine transferase (SPINDLY family)
MEEALDALQHAAQADPLLAEAQRNLGTVFQSLGRTQEALVCFQKAAAIRPDTLSDAIKSELMVPVIPASNEDIAWWRNRYEHGLEKLLDTSVTLQTPIDQLSNGSFYLAYHNQNNRSLMEKLHQLYRHHVPALTFTAPHINSNHGNQRIRVGFLSEFLFEHTIGKHYQGFIHHLDRTRFEVVVIHGPRARHDDFRSRLDQAADQSITLPNQLADQQQAVAAAELDVLFYPDIGMSSVTYFLAYARLAPVQLTSWGHPDTTGLSSMDYYLSATSNEPAHAQQNYSERLVRLNRLPCFYYRTPTSNIPPCSKAELGLPETGVLYGCPQNLFKLHPDFDAVLAAIAELDINGHLILPAGKYPQWTELLLARWSKTFPILKERVIFTPRMNWQRFMATLSHMDVLLDPLHFGSGNTFYDAMVFGTPVVTCPGRFARGRNVAAAYRQMGIADAPIVDHIEDYAPLAVALGRDTGRRKHLQSSSLAAAGQHLFEDRQAVRELESFLIDAVAAAAQHDRLPEYWFPHPLSQELA